MAPRPSNVPPPFDQGVFLLHYNHGREAFQEGRFAEARRELEAAQKMRPEDSDVLNLLGMVYFKTSAFPEAEVIYRRLANENPNVFILHSNLGLILYKQGKLDDAERYLVRSIELRPNYLKSHLYLGLLYKQKNKLEVALEHLQFAGADKVAREVEGMIQRHTSSTQRNFKIPALVSPPPPPRETVESASAPARVATPRPADHKTQPMQALRPETIPQNVRTPENPVPPGTSSAARKLQEAVDEPLDLDQKRHIDLAHKIEGASRTFTLHENGFLEINFKERVHVKRGTVSSYSGNLRFVAETELVGTTAQTLVKAEGHGKIMIYEKGRKAFLLDLNEEFIYVEGGNLLALEDSLSYRVEPIYDTTYQKKIDTVKIFGKGSLAISTSIEPITLRVAKDYPLSISSNALVAWTGKLIPTVLDERHLVDVMIEASDTAFKIRFEGDGIVVSEQ